jgi:serine protease AprX
MAWQASRTAVRRCSPRVLPVLILVPVLLLPLVRQLAPAAGPQRTGGPPPRARATDPAASVTVIVRGQAPGSAERLVRELGGTVTRDLPLVGGFSARVPAGRLPSLLGSPAVGQVWPDGSIGMRGLPPADRAAGSHAPVGAWHQAINLDGLGKDAGRATVAMLDTGVTPTPDLGARMLARVDLTEEHDGYDRYGHGSHLSGVIAGDGEMTDGRPGGARGGGYQGADPGARLVSVKVANGTGATDVSVVLAGLQWVVSNRARYGIKVLNLSFGTDAVQPHLVDPLDYAVEKVWRAGILVVVAAGNDGALGPGRLAKPADDPFVLTVGAADLGSTRTTADDAVAPFSSRGPTVDGIAKPDLVAPGVSILGIRAKGSTIDRMRPAARFHHDYFKGTGTSQAAAIVSGVAARLYAADPALRPDEAKAVLVQTAQRHLADQPGAGAGMVDARAAVAAVRDGAHHAGTVNQGLRPSTGTGDLEGSRGSQYAYTDLDGDGSIEPIVGETDALGRAWDGAAWTATPWTRPTWSRSPWSRLVAETPGWGVARWDGEDWAGMGWGGEPWQVKHWQVKHWQVKHWQLYDDPGAGLVKHWQADGWR